MGVNVLNHKSNALPPNILNNLFSRLNNTAFILHVWANTKIDEKRKERKLGL